MDQTCVLENVSKDSAGTALARRRTVLGLDRDAALGGVEVELDGRVRVRVQSPASVDVDPKSVGGREERGWNCRVRRERARGLGGREGVVCV